MPGKGVYAQNSPQLHKYSQAGAACDHQFEKLIQNETGSESGDTYYNGFAKTRDCLNKKPLKKRKWWRERTYSPTLSIFTV